MVGGNGRSHCRKTLQFLDFVQYSSMCIPGSFCPSVQQQLIQAVPVGDFTFQPIYRVRCPKGQVCPTGAVQPCPTGYVCPEEGLLYPYPCSLNPALNTTCYNAYLVNNSFSLQFVLLFCPGGVLLVISIAPRLLQSEPEPCPQGFICVAEYFQGLPTPNGTYVPVDGCGYCPSLVVQCPVSLDAASLCLFSLPGKPTVGRPTISSSVRGDIKLCELGDWCSIARSANGNDTDELKVPVLAYCCCRMWHPPGTMLTLVVSLDSRSAVLIYHGYPQTPAYFFATTPSQLVPTQCPCSASGWYLSLPLLLPFQPVKAYQT